VRKLRKTEILLILMLLVPVVQARLFVTTSETEARISDLDEGFRIGLINTGEDMNLTLETEGSVDVDKPEKVFIQGSDPTSTPEGSNWYYAGEGDYYPIKYIDMEAEIPADSQTRTHSFDLLISRVYETSRERPRAEEVRELNFQIYTTSDLVDTGFVSREPSNSENLDEGSENPEKTENKSSERLESPVNSSSGESAESSGQNDSNITFLLVAGTLLSAAWLIREVFT
jgi:hypothetical protein